MNIRDELKKLYKERGGDPANIKGQGISDILCVMPSGGSGSGGGSTDSPILVAEQTKGFNAELSILEPDLENNEMYVLAFGPFEGTLGNVEDQLIDAGVSGDILVFRTQYETMFDETYMIATEENDEGSPAFFIDNFKGVPGVTLVQIIPRELDEPADAYAARAEEIISVLSLSSYTIGIRKHVGGNGNSGEGGGVLVVNEVYDEDNSAYTLDKTWKEIYDAGSAVIVETNTISDDKFIKLVTQISITQHSYAVIAYTLPSDDTTYLYTTESEEGYPSRHFDSGGNIE